MSDRYALDRRWLRAGFERAAASYDAAAILQREVEARLLERLELIRLAPVHILDLGAGTGHACAALAARYPAAHITALDLAEAMLCRVRSHSPAARAVCADLHALPFADGRFDLVFSNLALQWADAPGLAFAEIHRVLAPQGLLLFTSFGPDTLFELRKSWAAADGHTHVNRFLDLHDLGDALLACRYADPVMDMERITLTYPDARLLMRDLKAIGAHNVNAGRSHALTGRQRLARMLAAYECHRHDGLLPATYEVLYGHAWKPDAGQWVEPPRR
jgi:malonyl-CoA O-methyltransferase